jgi:hypothetical protein
MVQDGWFSVQSGASSAEISGTIRDPTDRGTSSLALRRGRGPDRGRGGAVRRIAMTVREQETLLRGLHLWRKAVGAMSWEARAEASLALLIVRDDEIEELRRRIQAGEIQ